MTESVPRIKVWLTAARAFSFPASITPVLIGTALSHYAGFQVSWLLCALALVGMLCFHTVGNLLNDVYDFERGLDTKVFPTSGAFVRGWLTKKQVYRASAVLLGIGVLCGILLTVYTGWFLLVLGVAGFALTLTYTTPGFCFKYVGLGDLLIYLCFGLLPMYGSWWVQSQSHSWLPLLWSLPATCFTIGILHANNWRDIKSDRENHCRTIAVMLGDHGSELYYRALLVLPFVLVAGYVAVGMVFYVEVLAPVWTLAVLVVLLLVIKLLKVTKDRQSPQFAMLDGLTAQAQLAFGLILAVTLSIG